MINTKFFTDNEKIHKNLHLHKSGFDIKPKSVTIEVITMYSYDDLSTQTYLIITNRS